MESTFVLMRLGWAPHRNAFHALDEDDSLDLMLHLHLKNLIVLMDFFVPLVSCIHFLFCNTNLIKMIWLFSEMIDARLWSCCTRRLF